jgi:tRNA uridine 5-carboxymethylaminomethyl modification enzyme
MDFQLLPGRYSFKVLSSVAGFEKVKFFRPGYAIEYDYFRQHN